MPKVIVFVAGVVLTLLPWSATALEIGAKAPDFSLPATSGGKVGLSQFLGKTMVLIEFYGADSAPT